MNTFKNNELKFPLFMLGDGKTARVAYIAGGQNVRKRLSDIGIVPGKTIEVSQGGGYGPYVVKIGETKIMIGRGMLHKIYVKV